MTVYLLVAVYPSDSALPSQRPSDQERRVQGVRDRLQEQLLSGKVDIPKLFASLDADGDGVLTLAELHDGLAALGFVHLERGAVAPPAPAGTPQLHMDVGPDSLGR
jgi:hypothetical protein